MGLFVALSYNWNVALLIAYGLIGPGLGLECLLIAYGVDWLRARIGTSWSDVLCGSTLT